MAKKYIDPTLSLSELIKRQRKLYKTFVPVKCYMLNREVVFTFDGFQHLHQDGRNRRRGEKSARARLMLLDFAPAVITQARFMKKDLKEPNETYSEKKEIYYELLSRVGPKQVAVVLTLRQVGDGSLHFYGIRYKWKKATER
jgi:hypothetical protein